MRKKIDPLKVEHSDNDSKSHYRSNQYRLEGKIIEIIDERSGKGRNGDYENISFIFKVNGEKNTVIKFIAWNKSARQIQKIGVGMEIELTFYIKAKNYEGKYYNELTVKSIF